MNTRDLSPYEMTQLARHGKGNMPISDHIPIEYVTGIAEFCGLEFMVNPSVLIPRIETEGLVELSLQALAEKIDGPPPVKVTIVDVGTGSGAIIISVAKHLENIENKVHLFATDNSSEALTVAKANAEKLTTLPITFNKNNLLQDNNQQFDLIIANLPYIPSAEIKKLDKSVTAFEPLSALDGGESGFELIHQLITQAQHLLLPKGSLILEVDPSHNQSFFSEFEPSFIIQYFNDSFNRHRFVRLDLKN